MHDETNVLYILTLYVNDVESKDGVFVKSLYRNVFILLYVLLSKVLSGFRK